MADWEAFRGELEGAPVRQPPIDKLRERRRRRQQRKAIAATFAVVMIGGATGVSVLTRPQQAGSPTPAALNPVVTSTKLPPPPDYDDYVVTDVDFVSSRTGWALGLRCRGDACDVATWRTDDGGLTWGEAIPVAGGVPRRSYHDEDPHGGGVRSIRMLDGRNGYAFNPDLYVTSDGARTWTRLPRDSKVAAVSVAGDDAWLTQRGCPASVECDVTVEWAPRRPGGSPVAVDVPETNGAPALLRRAGADVAYLVTWNAPAEPRAQLWRWDLATGWRLGRMPCPDAGAVSMSARPGQDLWLVCTTPGGRTAWSSYDGTNWREVRGVPAEGTVTDLLGLARDDAYLTTQQPGAIWHWDGTAWRQAGVARAYGYANLDPVDGAVYAMGDAGQLWAGPGQWRRLALPPGAPKPAAAPAGRGLDDQSAVWTGVAFSDAANGLAVGERCADGECRIAVRRTRDGGVTWSGWDAPTDVFPERTGAHGWRLRLRDARGGWLLGVGAGYRTEAGGHVWQRLEEVPRDVRFGRGRDGAVTWELAGTGLVRHVDGRLPERVRDVPRGARLTVADADHAYLTDPDEVLSTADGGRTWTRSAAPCALGSVSAYAVGRLWGVCAGEPGGAQRQARSADGGRTWALSPLPGTGDTTGEIVAFSDTYAWRTGANRGVLVTRDGGRTWTGSPQVPDRVVAMTFLDPEHGWLIAGNVLYRTTDGRTWERLG
ncbi:MAG TPA: hypothetical protein VF519_17310 [Mycobacteriales bacterium]|jgi:hypothetical protein